MRHWYTTKVTDLSSADINEQIWVYREPLTYDSLPQLVHVTYRHEAYLSGLNYTVELGASAQGVAFRFTNFAFGWADEDVAQEVPLEKALHLPQLDPTALPALRRRLTRAVTGW